ncbi:MAG: ATP-binding protein, partial [Anaerolineales bacterium]
MSKFVGRSRELEELKRIISRRGAQFILVYGRRRVGKTTLLLRWAEESGRPYIYWVATRDTPAQVRLGLTRAVWRWAHPESQAVPRFDTWEDVFETTAQLIGDQRVILIMDEFSYAAESDPSLASHLQAAWDHLFKDSNITIVLAGSHIGMMVDLMAYQAPLYGR